MVPGTIASNRSAAAWVPAGVEYATDLAEPTRAEMRETLERMLRALDGPVPPVAAPVFVTSRHTAKPKVTLVPFVGRRG